MSPEQVRGEKVDARTDLFSFGVVLYEMATGQRAVSGETAPILRDAILNRTPAQARDLNPELPLKLAEIIENALRKDREARYQAASENARRPEGRSGGFTPPKGERPPTVAA
jgi:serine/threonine protein kinase